MMSTSPPPTSSPPAEPIRLFKPHENGPESISEILRRTTRKPLYCHPKSWCDLHLDVFRVEGVGKEYPIDHVLGCPVVCDPSDTDLAEVMEQLSAAGGRFHNIVSYHVRTGEKMSRIMEEGVAAVCYGILDDLWQNVRRYPLVDTNSYGGRPFYRHPKLHLTCKAGGKDHKIHLKTRKILVDFPDYEGYPDSFFPIVTFLCRNHDDYNPWKTKDLSDVAEEKRIIRWRRASKHAEVVALLIAAAQKQAERLPDNHQSENQCCANAICPLLIWAAGTHVQLVRGHIPCSHLDALEDPTKPISEVLKLEISPALDVLEAQDQPQILYSLAALLDQYFSVFRPSHLVG
ncbi:hypothetical protein FQN54_004059 [Arachnomyces sp. PD_36]|nr:hypothetical protein FQN54_004059 [Arachnomyces sp. PD_36]